MALTRRQVLWLLLIACSQLAPLRAAEPEIDDEAIVEDEPVESEPKIEDYKSPELPGPVYLADHFDDKERFEKIWIQSQAKKEDIDEDIAKYDGQYR